MWMLCLLLCGAEPREFVIVVDDTPQSKMIDALLEGSFTQCGIPGHTGEFQCYLEYVRENICQRAVRVHFTEVRRLYRLSTRAPETLPAIRYGTRYQAYGTLPDTAFDGYEMLVLSLKRCIDDGEFASYDKRIRPGGDLRVPYLDYTERLAQEFSFHGLPCDADYLAGHNGLRWLLDVENHYPWMKDKIPQVPQELSWYFARRDLPWPWQQDYELTPPSNFLRGADDGTQTDQILD